MSTDQTIVKIFEYFRFIGKNMTNNFVHFLEKSDLWSRVVGSLIIFSTIILNFIEVVVIFRRKRKNNYEKALLSLSINEFLMGIIAACLVSYVVIGRLDNSKHHVLVVWTCLAENGVIVSLNHLMLISVDRLWAISAPISHRSRAFRPNLAVFVLTVSWCVPVLASTVFILFIYTDDPLIRFKRSVPKLKQFMAVIILIADLVFFICYGSIVLLLLKRNQSGKRSYSIQQKRVLALCFSVVFVFILSSTPLVVVHVVKWHFPNWLEMFAWTIYPINAIVNSIIFLVQDYRIKRKASSNLRRESILLSAEKDKVAEKSV